jgi:hypothetical protein
MAIDIEAPGADEEELINALSRLQGVKNVKGYGATGDGVTNDAAAIQAAIDDAASPYSDTDRGIIFFPAGTYITGSTALDWSLNIRKIQFVGAPGAIIDGNRNGAVFSRPAEGPQAFVGGFYNLRIVNSHATGTAITMHSCIGGSVKQCTIEAHKGIETYNSQSVSIDSCNITMPGLTEADSVGVMAGNGTTLISTDIVGFQHGVRHQNAGLTILGGRMEVNTGAAIVLGLDENGDAFQSSGVLISSVSMESNRIGIYSASAAGVVLVGGVITANEVGESDYGIQFESIQDCSVIGTVVTTSVGFVEDGIKLGGTGYAQRTNLINVSCSASWDIASDANMSVELINCSGHVHEVTVTQLPTATSHRGRIINVSDANATTHGTVVAGGGSNHVSVVSSNGEWRIL